MPGRTTYTQTGLDHAKSAIPGYFSQRRRVLAGKAGLSAAFFTELAVRFRTP